MGVRVAKSECADAATCEQECDDGGPNACSRLGDLVYIGSAERAEDLWLDACSRGDGLGCYRLMSVAADEPDLADRLGLLACGYGEGDACEFAVKSMFIRSRAHYPDEDAEALARKVRSLVASQCEAGYLWSCIMALETASNRDSDERKRLALRAFELAPRDCRWGDVSACHFAAAQYDASGEQGPAAHLYARACGYLVSSNGSRVNSAVSQTAVCRRATELGAEIDRVAPAPRPGYVDVDPDDLKELHIERELDVRPPVPVKQALLKSPEDTIVGSFRQCVSSSGLVTDVGLNLSTGFPLYDRAILDAVRTWRYRPKGGRPLLPFCSNVVFIYRQR